MTNEDFNNSIRCCRLCKYFEGKESKCLNPRYVDYERESTLNSRIVEEGHLCNNLTETLSESSLKYAERFLVPLLKSCKVSKAKIKEFTATLYEVYNDYLQQDLEEEIGTLFIQANFDKSSFEGVMINNPDNFYCKDYH